MVSIEEVLELAAKFQEAVPGAVLVGGTPVVLYANHRESHDHDHVLQDLASRYESVLSDIAEIRGWKTSPKSRPPMTILGKLDDVPAGLRNLRRSVSLEAETISLPTGHSVTIPTKEEALRIKAYLVVNRNYDRDYVDVVALSEVLGIEKAAAVLSGIDDYYPESLPPVSELLFEKLSHPSPEPNPHHDLLKTRSLNSKYSQEYVAKVCRTMAERLV